MNGTALKFSSIYVKIKRENFHICILLEVIIDYKSMRVRHFNAETKSNHRNTRLGGVLTNAIVKMLGTQRLIEANIVAYRKIGMKIDEK